MEEIWKDVVGYEGLYQVSNLGNVRSLNYNGRKGYIKNLKSRKDANGYNIVCLSKEGNSKYKKVSILVAKAFIPNQENKPCVDHIIPISDGGLDTVTNLRWVTYPENNLNETSRLKNSNAHKGQKNCKEVRQETTDGRLIMIWNNQTCAERELGFKREGISACCRGKFKTYKGYIWKYA